MNQKIVGYLQENKGKYLKESLIAELQKAGYMQIKINEAVQDVYGADNDSNMQDIQNKSVVELGNKVYTSQRVIKKRLVSKIIIWIIYFIAFILPILGMSNCSMPDDGGYATVEYCTVDGSIFRGYANFYYGLMLVSAYMFLLPGVIYVLVVVFFARLTSAFLDGRNLKKECRKIILEGTLSVLALIAGLSVSSLFLSLTFFVLSVLFGDEFLSVEFSLIFGAIITIIINVIFIKIALKYANNKYKTD